MNGIGIQISIHRKPLAPVFGIVARRGALGAFPFDPVPQAMVITGIVVAFAASALAVALMLRLAEESGRVTLDPEGGDEGAGDV